MSQLNIILWTTSISLAVIGLSFGIIASVNSTKANHKITEILTSTFASEEAQKLFFDNVKRLISNNHRVIRILKNSKNLNYISYSTYAIDTRLTPIPRATLKIIKESEFQDVANIYSQFKIGNDEAWFAIIPDASILSNDVKVPAKIKKSLIAYHESANKSYSSILKSYSQVISLGIKQI